MVAMWIILAGVLALSILILLGKGDKLIAGYNTASEEERKQINIKRLRWVVAVVIWITCAICALLPYLPKPENPAVGSLIYMAIFGVIAIITVILANTWCKKK